MAYASFLQQTAKEVTVNSRDPMQQSSDDGTEDHDLALEYQIEIESKMLHEGSMGSRRHSRDEGRTSSGRVSSASHRSIQVETKLNSAQDNDKLESKAISHGTGPRAGPSGSEQVKHSSAHKKKKKLPALAAVAVNNRGSSDHAADKSAAASDDGNAASVDRQAKQRRVANSHKSAGRSHISGSTRKGDSASGVQQSSSSAVAKPPRGSADGDIGVCCHAQSRQEDAAEERPAAAAAANVDEGQMMRNSNDADDAEQQINPISVHEDIDGDSDSVDEPPTAATIIGVSQTVENF